RIEGVEVAAMGAIASGDADNHFIFNDQRRTRNIAAALRYIFDLNIPDFPPSLGINGDKVIVESSHKDQAITNGNAANRHTIRNGDLRQFIEIAPKSFSGYGIKGEKAIIGTHQIENAIHDKRRGIQSAFDFAGLKSPRRSYGLHIVAVDLCELAVTPSI